MHILILNLDEMSKASSLIFTKGALDKNISVDAVSDYPCYRVSFNRFEDAFALCFLLELPIQRVK